MFNSVRTKNLYTEYIHKFFVSFPPERHVKAHLHQASASKLRQLFNDTCDSVLIENNGVAPEWGCNLFSRDSTDFN